MQNRKETQMYRTDFWTLWETARVGCFKRTASKHVYYLGWNRSPAQVGCLRQALGPGALGRPRGIGWRGRWEEGSGWGIHIYPWLIHVYVWQKPLQYCKVISLQLIKKKRESRAWLSNKNVLNYSSLLRCVTLICDGVSHMTICYIWQCVICDNLMRVICVTLHTYGNVSLWQGNLVSFPQRYFPVITESDKF